MNFYARASEKIRPFAQLGINWTQFEAQEEGVPIFKEGNSNLILTAGLEIDVFSSNRDTLAAVLGLKS